VYTVTTGSYKPDKRNGHNLTSPLCSDPLRPPYIPLKRHVRLSGSDWSFSGAA